MFVEGQQTKWDAACQSKARLLLGAHSDFMFFSSVGTELFLLNYYFYFVVSYLFVFMFYLLFDSFITFICILCYDFLDFFGLIFEESHRRMTSEEPKTPVSL